MTTGIMCGKRPRNVIEDCDDCLPISKRINRLHIQSQTPVNGNGVLVQGQNAISEPVDDRCSWPQQVMVNTECGGQVVVNSHLVADVSVPGPSEDVEGYYPELNEQDNPLYFQINHVLYDAHIQRTLRQRTILKDS